MSSALLGAIIGGEIGLFVIGLFYLIKGKAKSSAGKPVQARWVRLTGLICIAPILLGILIALLTNRQQNLFLSVITLLTGPTGIFLAVIGIIVGMLVLYMAPTDPAKR